MPTPYPSQSDLQRLYDAREAAVEQLGKQATIETNDIRSLDRLGRFSIADRHWEKCSADARNALLNDEHHFVRSTASIAASRSSSTSSL